MTRRRAGRAAFMSTATTALVGALAGGGCGRDTGVVELAWIFVDRAGEQIFPAGAFSLGTRDSCGLPGRIGTKQVAFDLQVELEICDTTCDAGCGSSDCDVINPLRFSCKANRGSNPNIPSSSDPYLFTIHSVLVSKAEKIVCRDPRPTCIAVPGPRQRTVEPGLVVDLQVYQLAVDMVLGAPKSADGSLDLEACGCAP